MRPLTCDSQRVLIHIGYHKTGSTWFQSKLFARGDLRFRVWEAPRNAVHELFCDPAPFESGPEQMRADLVRQAQAAVDAGEIFVVSHERLSGYPASGGYDSALIASRLKAVFPNAAIFGVFRSQPDMILSAWRQQIVDGGDLTLKQFLNPVDSHIVRVPRFGWATYKYSGLVAHYQQLFGASRALFLPYELFAKQPQVVLAAIAKLIGLPELDRAIPDLTSSMVRENPSLSPTLLSAMRCVNLLFVRSQLSPHAVIDLGAARIRGGFRATSRVVAPAISFFDRFITARARRRIATFCAARYQSDNDALQRLAGVSLAEFGYDLPSPTSLDSIG